MVSIDGQVICVSLLASVFFPVNASTKRRMTLTLLCQLFVYLDDKLHLCYAVACASSAWSALCIVLYEQAMSSKNIATYTRWEICLSFLLRPSNAFIFNHKNILQTICRDYKSIKKVIPYIAWKWNNGMRMAKRHWRIPSYSQGKRNWFPMSYESAVCLLRW